MQLSKTKNILAIVGSASTNSSNLKLVEKIATLTNETIQFTIFNELKQLPHFDPELSVTNTPETILSFRSLIETADAIIICTPEYIFSIPSGLKNAIEWCISTTIFTNKPLGLITASAHGEKAHQELQLIMETAMAQFTAETTLLISGVKGKFDEENNIHDTELLAQLEQFITALQKSM
ncbi:NADPH-dependent FMN reductase [Flavobacterium sp. J27]|uniref:NADPH-dependent FMN reductase n=1 Tax=Flavobacterium sp. J27 TaxID=2060419 RepID=UPI00103180A8|nr:NADPH-dependent FMN reductase [Flavobacterium sp. J27]